MPATNRIFRLNPNPVPADGSFRGQRLLPALAADFARVEERGTADWLRYVGEYARRIRFPEAGGDREGRWDELYRGQPVMVVAQFLTWDVSALAGSFRDLRQATEDVNVNLVARRKSFTALFDLLLDSARELDVMVTALPPGTELATRAVSLIERGLAEDVKRWLAYYLAASSAEAGERLVDRDDQLIGELTSRYAFSSRWTGGADWAGYLTGISADDTIYGRTLPVTGADRNVAILHAVGHSFFHRTYTALIQAISHLRTAAQSTFRHYLTEFPGHAPHVALLLAVLRVSTHQRIMLNGLVDRHLRFYYNDILRLLPLPAQPHRAYLVVAPKTAFSLPEHTVFRGGKEAQTGLERQFLSERRLSVQPAEILFQRAVYKRAGEGVTLPFYAAEVVNSRDGNGEKLPAGEMSFRPFGFRDGESVGMDPARLGFRIVDPQLELAGGVRKIILRLDGDADFRFENFHLALDVRLTTEKGWHETTGKLFSNYLSINLKSEDPAITVYSEKAHELGIDVAAPVLEVTVPAGGNSAYEALRTRTVANLRLSVEVKEITLLELPGGGVLNGEKPFYPFGPLPGGGEIFTAHYAEARRKNANLATEDFSWKAGAGLEATSASAAGRLTLSATGSGWTHRGYAAAFAQALTPPTSTIPPQPADPQITKLSASYTTSAAAAVLVHHLLPFGFVTPSPNDALLPAPIPFRQEGEDAGALFIGISGWSAGTQLSLLFQIEEGTADPELAKPADHLYWSLLDGNTWADFPSDKIVDGTDQLLRSGIVHLDLPYDTSLVHDRLESGLAWLRLSVASATDAVNRLRGIHPNAVEVVQEPGAGEIGSDAPLPAGTIVGLLRPLSAIKSVEQPYASFGGAALESRSAYFTRSSERLRHRERAVTEWDVERLILGHFPEVERVICLPHVRDEDDYYHELAPGHVTVLPIGRFGTGTEQKPFVSLSVREGIANLLAAHASCHATFHVRNPRLEAVRVTADITLVDGTDRGWAGGQLQADLIGYLSPWQQSGLTALDFDGEVHRLAVVDFLEELPYVNTVHRLRMIRTDRPGETNRERLRPSRQVAVLVSAANHDLTIEELSDALAQDGSCTCAPTALSSRTNLEFV